MIQPTAAKVQDSEFWGTVGHSLSEIGNKAIAATSEGIHTVANLIDSKKSVLYAYILPTLTHCHANQSRSGGRPRPLRSEPQADDFFSDNLAANNTSSASRSTSCACLQ